MSLDPMAADVDMPLLRTKLTVPPPRSALVSRPRLIARLNDGLDDICSLILVSAPAGFGKTTLLSEWIHGSSVPEAVSKNVAWLSLDADDNDPLRFLGYLSAAIETVHERGENVRALLGSVQPPSIKLILTKLINSLASVPNRLVLVLDDYHLVEQRVIHDAVAFLLARLPPQVHMVVASRVDPPFPLARLRARNQLVELRAVDLRFTMDEASVFLNKTMGLSLSVQDVTSLEARTEGWISGLQLAALALQGMLSTRSKTDIAGFLSAFSGSHRHVIDYLAEEVLAQQPPGIHDFLCQTALLDRFTAPLCDAVTGRNDSADVLRQLERANLFVVSLDNESKWYRYHRLFADFMRSYLNQNMPERVRDLHCWAAEWYEKNGLDDEAVEHVLRAQDFEWAARLIERMARPSLMRGEINKLRRWLKALPGDVVRSRPVLGVFYGWTLLVSGRLIDLETVLQDAEQGLARSDYVSGVYVSSSPVGDLTAGGDDDLAQQIRVIRAFHAMFQGDMACAADLARQILDHLPQDNTFLRGIVTWLLGFAYYFDIDTTMASQAFDTSVRLGQMVGNTLLTLLSTYVSGYLQMYQGHFAQAQEAFEYGLALGQADEQPVWEEGESRSFPVGLSLIYQGLGELAREQNELQEAERYLVKCIELAEQWGNAEVLVDSYIIMSRIRQAQGDIPGAHDFLSKAEQFVHKKQVTDLTARQVGAYQARLWVAQGADFPEYMEAAARWADSLGAAQDVKEGGRGLIRFFVHSIERSSLLRLLLAQGRFAQAFEETLGLLCGAEAAGWTGIAIESLALQSLALQGMGRTNDALKVLRRALLLAEPQGYVRLFVDLGAPIAALLLACYNSESSGSALHPFVNRLLSGFVQQPATVPQSLSESCVQNTLARSRSLSGGLIEPLSERERDVLRLIADGLSNREIAERLFVALSTVKTHINHIYRKLDVSKRIQAVARARELGLLP
ncbi:MAG: helix-turn-helix transcriptional regulator [Anaerolineae bacterium]|nr:helix-turn-helix transcriptional regulator [Anaerolineae bacterium]